MLIQVKCVVTCRDARGVPALYPCVITCNAEKYDAGDHYDMAKAMAEDAGYENVGIVYDENDGPAWLFDNLWPAAKGVSLRYRKPLSIFIGEQT